MMTTPFKQSLVGATQRIDRLIAGFSAFVVLAATLVLLVCLAINVFVRYFNDAGGLSWVGELSAFLFPWMIAGGIVLGVQRGAHIAVDVLTTLLPERLRLVWAIAINLLVVATYAWLFHAVVGMMDIVAIEISPMLNLSVSWAYAALAYAALGTAACSLFIALRVMVQGAAALPQPEPEESGL
ncbi:TRAP-type C4-dicarboxylate transport system, small permease component [plant metagenome]|uniref:TRAP-type C4-dicarboxylate transport system, small permease component n=1 Tax=plant metagenome TaxID=1297885 RepID=A0A484RW36_9ZZZZ